MKKRHSFLMALCAATILSPAVASSPNGQQTDAAGAVDSRPAVKNPVTPHNHMRDGKGMFLPEEPAELKKDAWPVGQEGGETPKPVTKKKAFNTKKVRPHSHPQDGKGMYLPDKK